MYHTEPPTDKTIREWYMNLMKRTGSHSAGIHVPFTNCFVCRWFCVVHDPKPPLHSHNSLSFGKFQDNRTFLFTVNAIFRHDYPLDMEPGSTPRPLVQKKLGQILYLLLCSFLPCLSWLLRSRFRKFRRDLWITLYISGSHSGFNKEWGELVNGYRRCGVTCCLHIQVLTYLHTYLLHTAQSFLRS